MNRLNGIAVLICAQFYCAGALGLDCLGGPPPSFIPQIISSQQDVAYYNSRTTVFGRQSEQINGNPIAVFGDSQIDSSHVANLSARAVNLGISGGTWRDFLNRLSLNPSTNIVHRSDACILLLGINDIVAEGPNYIGNIQFMIDIFAGWATGKWVIVQILPVNELIFQHAYATNARIDAINAYLVSKFSNRSGFAMVDAKADLSVNGQLDPAKTADGLHLNAAGYEVLFPKIGTALISLGVTP